MFWTRLKMAPEYDLQERTATISTTTAPPPPSLNQAPKSLILRLILL
jgi:hypothetical protein